MRLRPARSYVLGSRAGSATTMPNAPTRHWPGARPTRHMGQRRRRDWRPDDNPNRAYPSRQTVQPDGSTSDLPNHGCPWIQRSWRFATVVLGAGRQPYASAFAADVMQIVLFRPDRLR